VEEAVTAVLYPLWDAGLRASHVVRMPEECEAEAGRRLESLTAMATARVIGGDREIADEACTGCLQVARRQGDDFVRALRASRAGRERRFGRLAHLLEPDLKESLGGIRDRQLGAWIRWVFSEADRHEPPQSVSLTGVRLALHTVNGGSSNRLLADHHATVAAGIGLKDQPGWEARDLLMRDVAEAGRALDRWAERFLDEVSPTDEFGRTSGNPRIEEILVETGGSPSGGRWSTELLEAFMSLLRTGDAIGGFLDEPDAQMIRKWPEWQDVRGRPQRDPYHRYPVDVHLVTTASETVRLLGGSEEPFAAQAAEAVTDPDALLLGALLHDIGKVGRGSHVPLGVEIAGRTLDRMGIGGPQRDDVLFLVGEHLLLSDTATRRNIEEEDLAVRIADRVGTQERLAMLYLLTLADAKATGPSACTPWRLALIRELVSKVSAAMQRSPAGGATIGRVERAEERVKAALGDRPAERVEAFIQSFPSAYLMWVNAADVGAHFDLMESSLGPNEIRSQVRPGRTQGGHLVTVVARDRLGLLSDVAGALAVSGLTIMAAQAFTSDRGLALDEFDVRGAFEPVVEEQRWERFRSILRGSLDGSVLAERLRSLRAHYPAPAAAVPVHVGIDQSSSQSSTVVEVEASDRIGLLFDLTRALASLGIDVHLAKVATYGARVVDVFYVTDEEGQKIEDRDRLTELERALVQAARS